MNAIRLAAALAVLCLAGMLVPVTSAAWPARPADTNPLAGINFYVDPRVALVARVASPHTLRSPAKANLIWKIAREPKAVWVGRFTRPNFNVKVRRIIDGAQSQGQVPILTVLRAQSTGCSPSYDGGGRAEDARLVRRPGPRDRR